MLTIRPRRLCSHLAFARTEGTSFASPKTQESVSRVPSTIQQLAPIDGRIVERGAPVEVLRVDRDRLGNWSPLRTIRRNVDKAQAPLTCNPEQLSAPDSGAEWISLPGLDAPEPTAPFLHSAR